MQPPLVRLWVPRPCLFTNSGQGPVVMMGPIKVQIEPTFGNKATEAAETFTKSFCKVSASEPVKRVKCYSHNNDNINIHNKKKLNKKVPKSLLRERNFGLFLSLLFYIHRVNATGGLMMS